MKIGSGRKRAIAPALVTAGALALAGCAGMGKQAATTLPVADAHAQLYDAKGADRGRADFYRDTTGLRVELVARGFAPSTYGMHVHAVGRCDGPKFTTAGPHWNPTNAQHGRDNPLGAHHGDLPNLVVEPETIGRATLTLVGTRLTGEGGMLDGDGAAFVIHAGPDDMKTDPSGNSGDRVACGVIVMGGG
ncbi:MULTISPECIES: superoxide dismutase family protein [unclassified Sphingopyxis]|uniref:superoxide dismutase family protein n=1 Tax=unclassified Sphingopyxis TaxID=2614943 RepID=UPI002854A147|nr:MULTISPECIES: superoxide dismutase family protein [unclassified Sphingopyxis]MDR6833563.1 Cu-Zn family superoxide dismutase [Sphingopyxis sp. BE122]MDR7225832.1 Cu-Zn family superoxide dismutase [Sphingopyxis sp. BE259]